MFRRTGVKDKKAIEIEVTGEQVLNSGAKVASVVRD
jgi:hypothetical protein